MGLRDYLSKAGERIFSPSKTESVSNSGFGGAINDMYASMSFNSMSDFIQFYKSEAFKIAYTQMDAFTCYNLAYSNSWISAVINAIARPMSSADIVGVAKDPEKPNDLEIDYINELFKDPNPYDTSEQFRYDLAMDLLSTGNYFIEVAYNQYGFPVSLYRHYPYMVSQRKDGRYVHKNGYVFEDGEIIHVKLFNPFDDKRGMSPLVPVVAAIMLDSNIINHNMKYYENNQLKGILSVDKEMGFERGRQEVENIQEQISQMKKRGEEGHLAAFGVGFQAISSTNRDMMTPEMEKSVRERILAVYGVPPSKIALIETGSIGGGVGETQADTLNDTLDFWAKIGFIGPFNKHLLPLAKVQDTLVDFTNLTKKDDMKEAQLQKQWIDSYSSTINEIRALQGKDPYDIDIANEPLVPNNLVPLSSLLVEPEPEVQPKAPLPEPKPIDEEDPEEDVEQFMKEYKKLLKSNGLVKE
jgi:HK97 family phage portal protein